MVVARPLPTFRLVLLFGALALAALAQAQQRFNVNGRLRIEGGGLESARVVVYKDGVKERTITTNLSKLSLAMDHNANYMLSFEKDGYVTKMLHFNTTVPRDAAGRTFTPFEFTVSLFKQYDDVNMVVFSQPVGVIRYDRASDDFDYDTDYTKSIQQQLQATLAEVEKKQKEEQRNAAEESKRQAAQAKAQAKAEAEQRKAAEAEARAEAARQEAERKAAEEKARQERAEAEKRSMPQANHTPLPPPPPPAPAPPPPPVKPTPKPAPLATRPAANMPPPVKGEESRRTTEPVVAQDSRPPDPVHQPQTFRHEELVIESNRVTTIIVLDTDGQRTEYRRVFHKFGGTYFFKNGEPCSAVIYEQEALSGRDGDDLATGGRR